MKILLLVNHFAEFGGIQRMLNHKILAFTTHANCEIILVTRFQNNRDYLYESHQLTKKYDLKLDGNTSFFGNQVIKFSFYKKISKIIKDEKPDVVITTLTSFYSLILPFIRKKTIKILEFHSTASTMKAGRWKFKRLLYKLYDAVVVLNKDEKNNYDLKNTFVIPNFVHAENLITYPEFKKRKHTLIAAGRIEPVKQFDHLILAWAQISTQYPEWKLEIYGDGNEKSALQSLIQENQLSNSVHLMGNTKNLFHIMREASIYGMTSLTDCFPMVLLEAKQAGLPIISYDCQYGPKNIIHHDSDGFLIEKDNISAFSNAIEKLILNTDIRENMSINSFKNAEEFSSGSIVKLWFSLFTQLKVNIGE
ncbi:glycosyltransferase family 4 protein [Flavobacterium sp.]|uniref:glycosyltransferase family 4 protein n=1 Tax=Flavobacterium sp. TaxID=239 RepID=UPI00286E6423|nr:glycosyltransferase family 4 protein [Flavobacterium sp.]